MIRKNKNIVFCISIFVVGIFLISCKFIYDYTKEQENEKKIQMFFENEVMDTKDTTIENEKSKKSEKKVEEKYIAILVIPNISLKKGLYDKNSKNNNVNKNIQIIENSDMPDLENGTLILAGHSGSGEIAYFQKLEQLNLNDDVYIYYKENKYHYKINSIYLEEKNGYITINNSNEFSRIVLTTCSQKEKGKQLIIIGNLIEKSKY